MTFPAYVTSLEKDEFIFIRSLLETEVDVPCLDIPLFSIGGQHCARKWPWPKFPAHFPVETKDNQRNIPQ
jgi:hypothetical protein